MLASSMPASGEHGEVLMRTLGPVRGRVAERVILRNETERALSMFEAAVEVLVRFGENGAYAKRSMRRCSNTGGDAMNR